MDPLLKTLVIKFKPTFEQKKILNRDLNTSNYMYNKSLHYVKNKGFDPIKDRLKLRDILVTKDTQINDPLYKAFRAFIKTIRDKFKKDVKTPYIASYKNKTLKLRDILLYIYKKEFMEKRIKFINKELTKAKKTIPTTSNIIANDWEYKTNKDVRAEAVFTMCNAYKTGIANVKAGNIKMFNIKYRNKKKFGTSMVYSQKMIKISNKQLYFTSNKMKNKLIKVGKITQKKLNKINININHDMTICKKHNEYFLNIPLDIDEQELVRIQRIVGIDPGVRVFMTCFGNDSVTEYKQNTSKLDYLDYKINLYSKRSKLDRYHRITREPSDELLHDGTKRYPKGKKLIHRTYEGFRCTSWSGFNNYKLIRKRIRKRKYNKLERKKSNLVNELHWTVIKSLIDNNDTIFLGKLDSQGFVKGGKNKTLNRRTNNLKHYLFRQRLIYKAKVANKYVKIVPEHYTTKTCCNCGKQNDPKKSKIYTCSGCNKSFDRDINSAKNIILKGMLY